MAYPIIPITKTTHPRLPHFKIETLQFGKHFTDHMLTADYIDGEWKNIEIKPYAPFEVDPASAVLHYGQTIFEGIKAYKNAKDEVVIFRPDQNFIRFNVSADRMQMPAVPEWLFLEGMKQLIALDKDWIPSLPEH
ncbi:MAG: branched chain amino acid aminotransferase, partial [Burkholderiaceae bacterium]